MWQIHFAEYGEAFRQSVASGGSEDENFLAGEGLFARMGAEYGGKTAVAKAPREGARKTRWRH